MEIHYGSEKAHDLSVLDTPLLSGSGDLIARQFLQAVQPQRNFLSIGWRLTPFSFFEENEVDKVRPFFYQAMTEIGMYGYRVKPFSRYLSDTANITFKLCHAKRAPGDLQRLRHERH